MKRSKVAEGKRREADGEQGEGKSLIKFYGQIIHI
jgi:hypothetical protein